VSDRPWPGQHAPEGWYVGPSGTVLRWWTGTGWGHDVALLGRQVPPGPPPVERRHLVLDAPTEPLTLPATACVPLLPP
jgi:hypothetical protein